ncbi:MAG TPA: hypothetical protein VFU21_08175 [Kofleriaceae bacterium]|nr:hypothetical protein [Kofleriaceae bacterium]
MTVTSPAALRTILFCSSLAALAGCVTAADDGSIAPPAVELLTCAPGEARLAGDVDGVAIEASAARVISRAFADADRFGASGFLDVELDTGDHISLAWDEPLHDAEAAAATGVLDSSTSTYSTCVHDVLPGLVQVDPATGALHFSLSHLQRGGICDQTIAGGELTGCIGPAPVPLAE